MATWSEAAENMAKKAKDFVESMANSSYVNNVFPTKASFMDEVGEAINNNAKLKTKLHANEINKQLPGDIQDFAQTLKELGENIDIDGDKAKKIARVMHSTDYSEASFEKLNKALQKEGMDSVNAAKITDFAKENAKEVMSKESDINSIGTFQKPGVYLQTYFSNPDKKVKTQRIATIAGAYAGVAVGGRYLSGGTLTRDNYGRKDIAGVPFL